MTQPDVCSATTAEPTSTRLALNQTRMRLFGAPPLYASARRSALPLYAPLALRATLQRAEIVLRDGRLGLPRSKTGRSTQQSVERCPSL